MKILSVNTFFPYPRQLGMDYIYSNILRLQAEKHNLTLVTIRRSPDQVLELEAVKPYCDSIYVVDCPNTRSFGHRVWFRIKYKVLSWLLWRPLAALYDTPPALAKLISDLTATQHFDVVELHHSPIAALVRSVHNSPTVLYMYDAHYRSLERLADTKVGLRKALIRLEARRFRSFEVFHAAFFRMILFGQDEDKSAIDSAIRHSVPVGLMPNVLDVGTIEQSSPDRDNRIVVFVGAMTHRANVDAVVSFSQFVWPKIRARQNDAQFWIVGRSPPSEVLALDGMNGIRVLADVADVRPLISAASVYVAPLRIGSGVKVKVMEAMALGKAIVATPVAVEGMGLKDGVDLRTAVSDEQFGAAVVELLEDWHLRRMFEERAKSSAADRFSFEAGRRQLDRVYASIVN